MPDNNQSPKPMLAHIAVDVILTKDDQILLLQRFGTSSTPGKHSLIGGKCDEGESIIQAAAREVYEEIGVHIEPEDLQFVHVIHKIMPGDAPHKDWFFFFFAVTRWHGEPFNKEPKKHKTLAWFPLNALPTLGETHLQAINEWRKANFYSIVQ